MDIETGIKTKAMNGTSTEGLRKRYSRLADDVIEQLVMECTTDEEYQKVVSALLSEASSPAAVAALRQKLETLRQMMSEREIRDAGQRKIGMIDDTFLSVTFAVALIVILAVTLYAFQGLFSAIYKKLPINATRPNHRST